MKGGKHVDYITKQVRRRTALLCANCQRTPGCCCVRQSGQEEKEGTFLEEDACDATPTRFCEGRAQSLALLNRRWSDRSRVHIQCLIENPSFDSQTKETMTTPVRKFGSKCELPEEFLGSRRLRGLKDRSLTER